MLDQRGYRPNVGIIIVNRENKVFWGKRIKQYAWQFPQGGINQGEMPGTAMYRELMEEVGLSPIHVEIIGKTQDWLYYDVPSKWLKKDSDKLYRGQKQIWYLLKFIGFDSDISLRATKKPEFDGWRWIDYWKPVQEIVDFKRDIYQTILTEFAPLLGIEKITKTKHDEK